MKDLLAALSLADAAALAALRIAIILAGTWIIATILHRVIRLFRTRIEARIADVEAIKRAETLGRAFRYTANVVLSLIAG